jgi:hypothetical protein
MATEYWHGLLAGTAALLVQKHQQIASVHRMRGTLLHNTDCYVAVDSLSPARVGRALHTQQCCS